MVTEQRHQHPFYMYEAIYGQPEAFASVVQGSWEVANPAVTAIAACQRVFLVGIGTSYHAAQIGEHLLREYTHIPAVQAVHGFDFALYGPRLLATDCVIAISHRGNKTYTVQSLQRAQAAGCATLLITGEGSSAPEIAQISLHTVPQDRSSAHTISYTGTLAVLATIATKVGHLQQGSYPLSRQVLTEDLPGALRGALATEPQITALAQEYAEQRRYWFVGGGPGAVTAQESALKVKETSYLQAEGIAIETMLHGPLQCTEAEDLFLLIAPGGPAQPRILELAKMLNVLEAPYLLVSDREPAQLENAAGRTIVVPSVPESLTALTCLIPLQLFAYALAIAKGKNPDGFRFDDARFAQAFKLIRL